MPIQRDCAKRFFPTYDNQVVSLVFADRSFFLKSATGSLSYIKIPSWRHDNNHRTRIIETYCQSSLLHYSSMKGYFSTQLHLTTEKCVRLIIAKLGRWNYQWRIYGKNLSFRASLSLRMWHNAEDQGLSSDV